MRGTPVAAPAPASSSGLIPTYAGNTPRKKLLEQLPEPHPHVCGEHVASKSAIRSAAGSSPRVWGALIDAANGYPVTRLIPTCVGSTRSIFGLPFEQRAHPHVCGEHTLRSWAELSRRGSSPRVWGAQGHAGIQAHIPRLIPTCVGST